MKRRYSAALSLSSPAAGGRGGTAEGPGRAGWRPCQGQERNHVQRPGKAALEGSPSAPCSAAVRADVAHTGATAHASPLETAFSVLHSPPARLFSCPPCRPARLPGPVTLTSHRRRGSLRRGQDGSAGVSSGAVELGSQGHQGFNAGKAGVGSDLHRRGRGLPASAGQKACGAAVLHGTASTRRTLPARCVLS